MNQFIKVGIIMLTLFFPFESKCGEFESWWQTTPKGNIIGKEKWNNEYVIGIVCKNADKKSKKNGHTLKNLEKWYFYRSHIIGEFKDSSSTKYFVLDELNCEYSIYKNENDFNIQIKQKRLKPLFWTRWYNSNWGVIITSCDFGEGINFMFITLPLIIASTVIMVIYLIIIYLQTPRKFYM